MGQSKLYKQGSGPDGAKGSVKKDRAPIGSEPVERPACPAKRLLSEPSATSQRPANWCRQLAENIVVFANRLAKLEDAL